MPLLKNKQLLLTETSRAPCRVSRYLGGGGQGEVYRADLKGTTVALKWYLKGSATKQQRYILEDLIARSPPDNRFLWPMELVSDSNMAGFGYIMSLREPHYKGLVDLVKGTAKPSFHSLATAGYQLADSYYQLHAKGLCYRDISFGNVFFDPKTGDVRICDNDNVGVNHDPYSGVLGTPRFMAPEIVCGRSLPDRDSDLYSLAVLLFFMFMVAHPLEGLHESEINCIDLHAMVKLYGTDPLFIFHPTNESNRPHPKFHFNALDNWPLYPQFLRDLFIRSFTEGLTNTKHGRVRETQWRQAMVRLRDSIYYCHKCSAKNFYDADDTVDKSTCWHCQASLQQPFRLQLGTNGIVVLNHDTKLFLHHLDGEQSYDFTRIAAEVSLNPKDPKIWGLKNMTKQKWVATSVDGTMSDIEPGRTTRLKTGTKINFRTIEGTIQH